MAGENVRNRRAFTLVELLVVIGIIGLLIGVLLPTLARARSASYRAMCLSNQRQIMLAMNLYANQNKGWLPTGVTGGNPGGANICWRNPNSINSGWTTRPERCRPWNNEGWWNLGYLVFTNLLKDPRALYCPEAARKEMGGWSYPENWQSPDGSPPNGDRVCNYIYRFCDLGSGPPWPAGPRLGSKKNNTTWMYDPTDPTLASDKTVTSNAAIICDQFAYPYSQLQMWPHTRPYGLCVGYADGHAQYWPMQKKDYDTILKLKALKDSDLYITRMWRGFDTGDFTAARAAFP